jgi:PST family polysaccharide transporter
MKNKKHLLSNFLSLYSLQAANYILPLVTIPYLVRVIGPEKFGLISFSQAFIQYFVLLTDYGFNLSATRAISIHREDKDRVSQIFSSIMVIKLLFAFLSFSILCLLVFSIQKFRADGLVYLLTFGIVAGDVLLPIWFFLGTENMRHLAIVNILSKGILTASIFIFITSEKDYIYVPLINSLGFILAGSAGLWIVIRRFKVRIKIPSAAEIEGELREGWHVFVSTIATSLYTVSNAFILGLFTNNTIVGYFSAGEKLVRAVVSLIGPFGQALYPHISKLASESRERALLFVRKVVQIVSVPTFFLSLTLLIFAPQISRIILGRQYDESIPVIRILSFLPFIIGLSYILGVQAMLNFGLKKIFTRILVIAGLINILLALTMVSSLQHIGISLSNLITEAFVTACMVIYLQRNGIRILHFNSGMVRG